MLYEIWCYSNPLYIKIKLIRRVDTSLQNAPIGSIRVTIQLFNNRPLQINYDVIKWKHFPRFWPFCVGNSTVTGGSPHKGQWREALMFSLIYAWINGWTNNRDAGEFRGHCAHYDAAVMLCSSASSLIHTGLKDDQQCGCAYPSTSTQ